MCFDIKSYKSLVYYYFSAPLNGGKQHSNYLQINFLRCFISLRCNASLAHHSVIFLCVLYKKKTRIYAKDAAINIFVDNHQRFSLYDTNKTIECQNLHKIDLQLNVQNNENKKTKSVVITLSCSINFAFFCVI